MLWSSTSASSLPSGRKPIDHVVDEVAAVARRRSASSGHVRERRVVLEQRDAALDERGLGHVVGVEREHVAALAHRDPGVARAAEAAVGLVQDPQRMARGERVEHPVAGVERAVVDDDDLEARGTSARRSTRGRRRRTRGSPLYGITTETSGRRAPAGAGAHRRRGELRVGGEDRRPRRTARRSGARARRLRAARAPRPGRASSVAERVAERLGAAARTSQPVAPSATSSSVPADGGRQHGHVGLHRLEHRVRPALPARRHHEHVVRADRRERVGARERAGERDPLVAERHQLERRAHRRAARAGGGVAADQRQPPVVAGVAHGSRARGRARPCAAPAAPT